MTFTTEVQPRLASFTQPPLGTPNTTGDDEDAGIFIWIPGLNAPQLIRDTVPDVVGTLVRVGNVVAKSIPPVTFHVPWKWVPIALVFDTLTTPGWFVHVGDVWEAYGYTEQQWREFLRLASTMGDDGLVHELPWFALANPPTEQPVFPAPNPLPWDP